MDMIHGNYSRELILSLLVCSPETAEVILSQGHRSTMVISATRLEGSAERIGSRHAGDEVRESQLIKESRFGRGLG